MSLHVGGKVVGPGKDLLADVALEGTLPGVFPVVAGQLVRPGEFPATAFPIANVRLLTGVCSKVAFEVG